MVDRGRVDSDRDDKSEIGNSRTGRFDNAFWPRSPDAPGVTIPNAVIAERPSVDYSILCPILLDITGQVQAVFVTYDTPKRYFIAGKRSFCETCQSIGRKSPAMLHKKIDYTLVLEVCPFRLVVEARTANGQQKSRKSWAAIQDSTSLVGQL